MKGLGLLLLPLVACEPDRSSSPNRGDTPAPTESASATASVVMSLPSTPEPPLGSSSTPFTMQYQQRTLVFQPGFATATVSGSLLAFQISTEPLGCAKREPSPGSVTITFDVAAGPGASFFAGHVISVPVWLRTASASAFTQPAAVSARHVRLRLEPFKLKAGERVLGELEIADPRAGMMNGRGRVELELCDDYPKLANVTGLPATVPAQDISGLVDGRAFRPRSALAILAHDPEGGPDYLEKLAFFENDARCQPYIDRTEPDHRDVLGIHLSFDRFGVTTRRLPVKTPLHAYIGDWSLDFKRTAEGLTMSSIGLTTGPNAWLSFDALDLKPGAILRGSLVASTSTRDENSLLQGRFEAVVCAP